MQSSCFQICLYHRQETVHCTIYGCISIDKQRSYMLAFMSQAKTLDMLGAYRLLRHHLTQCAWPDYWSWILSLPSLLCYYNQLSATSRQLSSSIVLRTVDVRFLNVQVGHNSCSLSLSEILCEHTYSAGSNGHVIFYTADILKAISHAGFEKPSPIQVWQIVYITTWW